MDQQIVEFGTHGIIHITLECVRVCLVYARCRSRGISFQHRRERQPCFTNTYMQNIKSILFTHGRDLLDDKIIRPNIQSLWGAEGGIGKRIYFLF
jgi:hypothetical protein